MLTARPDLFNSLILNQGYSERKVTKYDPEVKLYDVTVSTARASDGRLNLDADFFVWKCPITSFARITTGFIPHMKLYDNTGAELPETALVLFKVRNPLQRRGVIIAEAPYSNWKRLTVSEQQDSQKNAALVVNFTVRQNPNDPNSPPVDFIDILPNWELVFSITGTSSQVDVDQENFLVEFYIGLKTT